MVLLGEGTPLGLVHERRADDEAGAALDPSAPPRLHHEPALDGLRGVAVAVVVVFHLERLTGGFLGVDLFFVLSGYLITSLLLVEHGGRERIDLGRFWSRRARRLLPALFLLMAGVALLLGTATPAGERPIFRGEALATLGYVANWQAMGDEVGYWDMFRQPSPLDHMWSLAIEEQFYLLWPLLVVGLLALARRARLVGTSVVTAVAALGALASFVVLAVTYSPLDTSRAYYGTDARVGPTLLGAALAGLTMGAAGRTARRTAGAPEPSSPAVVGSAVDGAAEGAGARRWRPWLAAAAVAVMGWSFLSVGGIRSWYYRGGLVVFALASVTLVHLVTGGRGGVLGRALSVRPLVALGTISYGVYLWHWPVLVYLTPEDMGIGRAVRDVLCVVITLALATASYLLVERPVRRGALRGRPVRVALVGSVAAVAVAVLVVTGGVARVPGTDVALAESDSGTVVYPESIPAGSTRILLVGDSGPIYLGQALADEAARHDAVAAADARPFCPLVAPEGIGRDVHGRVVTRTPCHEDRRAHWSRLVESFEPDVVVYYIAAGGGMFDYMLDGAWVAPCDERYEDYVREALAEDADVLGAGGATVALATTPEAPIVRMGGDTVLDALSCRRATFHAIVDERPGTRVLDMAGFINAAERGYDESAFYRDLVHLSDLGAEKVAEWMVGTVGDFPR